jgi:L-ribulose-5-phosphate 3-epimerase
MTLIPRLPLALALFAIGFSPASHAAEPAESTPRYRIGVCDWMILKRQKLSAFARAKELGAQGLELDMGSLGQRPTFDSKLGEPVVRQQFLDESKKLDVAICSISMAGFFGQSFAEREGVEKMVQDGIDAAKALGVKVMYLPLGTSCDLVKRPELRPAIVERLKAAGKKAEEAGVVIGVETALPAKDEVALLEEIGSPAVKIYFNLGNATMNDRDIVTELKTLGKDRLVQIHGTAKDGVWLENDPKVDLPKIKAALDEMGWSGWLVAERSRDAKRATDVTHNFTANVAYLKKVFQ